MLDEVEKMAERTNVRKSCMFRSRDKDKNKYEQVLIPLREEGKKGVTRPYIKICFRIMETKSEKHDSKNRD
jgi:hypothetical protein